MQERPKAIQRIIQSPTISILVALGATGTILFHGENAWLIALLSVATATLMFSQIKARVMYRGAYYPFLGIFMLAQSAIMPSLSGSILTLITVMALTALLICYNQPWATRTFFVIYLAFGTGALLDRSYSLMGLLLFAALVLVRCFSARSLVASILGYITPAIITLPLNIIDINAVISAYNQAFTIDYSLPLTAIGGIAFLAGASTFITAYGYPARSRARNMAMLGLTVGAIALPFLDFANVGMYTGLLNICMAYNVCHFISQKRISWLYIVVMWLAIGALIYFQ